MGEALKELRTSYGHSRRGVEHGLSPCRNLASRRHQDPALPALSSARLLRATLPSSSCVFRGLGGRRVGRGKQDWTSKGPVGGSGSAQNAGSAGEPGEDP